MNLYEDFKYWWDLPKHKKADIPARKLGDLEVVRRHGSKQGWPGKGDVKYWVELENGTSVGFLETKSENGRRRVTFPVVENP